MEYIVIPRLTLCYMKSLQLEKGVLHDFFSMNTNGSSVQGIKCIR